MLPVKCVPSVKKFSILAHILVMPIFCRMGHRTSRYCWKVKRACGQKASKWFSPAANLFLIEGTVLQQQAPSLLKHACCTSTNHMFIGYSESNS